MATVGSTRCTGSSEAFGALPAGSVGALILERAARL